MPPLHQGQVGLHSTQGLVNWKASHPLQAQDWASAGTPRGNRTREVSQPLPIVLEPCQAGAERGPVLGRGAQARRSVFFLSSQPARNTAVTKEPSLGAEPLLSLFPARLCASQWSHTFQSWALGSFGSSALTYAVHCPPTCSRPAPRAGSHAPALPGHC